MCWPEAQALGVIPQTGGHTLAAMRGGNLHVHDSSSLVRFRTQFHVTDFLPLGMMSQDECVPGDGGVVLDRESEAVSSTELFVAAHGADPWPELRMQETYSSKVKILKRFERCCHTTPVK